MTSIEHIESLKNHGACIKAGSDRISLTADFYRKAVKQCEEGGYNAVTYDLILPDIDEPLMIAFWRDGHIDSGSAKNICDCLASR